MYSADPFFGHNFDAIKADFTPTNFSTSSGSKNIDGWGGQSWWFRTDITMKLAAFRKAAASAAIVDQYVRLKFKGVNYRADVWCNGIRIADATTFVGTFRYFDIDLTTVLKSTAAEGNGGGGAPPPAILAVEVWPSINSPLDGDPPATKRDLAISFVDWVSAPWRDWAHFSDFAVVTSLVVFACDVEIKIMLLLLLLLLAVGTPPTRL